MFLSKHTQVLTMSLAFRANFLFIIAVVFFAYAILWGLAPYPSINFPARLILDLADWPLDSLSIPLDKNTQFLSAIGSGELAAISIFLGGIVVPAIKDRNTVITRQAIIAMSTWYILDSSGSIAAGVASNVFFNSIYFILVLIPLVGIKNAIKD